MGERESCVQTRASSCASHVRAQAVPYIPLHRRILPPSIPSPHQHRDAAGDGLGMAVPGGACRGVPLSAVHHGTFLLATLLTAKSSPGRSEE